MKKLEEIIVLNTGSHSRPSDGTCINEAALIIAGFAYRQVTGAESTPDCFCRLLAGILLNLNDSCGSGGRKKLVRFTARLPGSADSPEITRQRAEYLIKNVTKVFPRGTIYEDYLKSNNLTSLAARLAGDLGALPSDQAFALLDGAFDIGKQADPIDIGCVIVRAKAARAAWNV